MPTDSESCLYVGKLDYVIQKNKLKDYISLYCTYSTNNDTLVSKDISYQGYTKQLELPNGTVVTAYKSYATMTSSLILGIWVYITADSDPSWSYDLKEGETHIWLSNDYSPSYTAQHYKIILNILSPTDIIAKATPSTPQLATNLMPTKTFTSKPNGVATGASVTFQSGAIDMLDISDIVGNYYNISNYIRQYSFSNPVLNTNLAQFDSVMTLIFVDSNSNIRSIKLNTVMDSDTHKTYVFGFNQYSTAVTFNADDITSGKFLMQFTKFYTYQ